jgi:hypothetical protein
VLSGSRRRGCQGAWLKKTTHMSHHVTFLPRTLGNAVKCTLKGKDIGQNT